MQGALSSHSTRRGLALALLLFMPQAGALQIGEIEVRSALGEALDARVPLTVSRGEYIHGSCFSLLREIADSPVPVVSDGRLTMHTSPGGKRVLRIRSAAELDEPAYSLALRAACAGSDNEVVRNFVLLVDPPQLRRTARAEPAPLPPRSEVRAAPTTVAAAARPRPPPAASVPKPAVAPLPPARETTAAVPQQKTLSPPARTPRPSSDFVLKLSAPDVDLSRSRGIDDVMRARLRERQLVLDADDHVAAFLALRHSVKQLESKVADLQLKLSTVSQSLEARAAAAPPKVEPPKVEAPKVEPAKVEAPKVEAPKVQPPKPEPPKPEPPKPEPPKVVAPPSPAPPPATAEPSWIDGVDDAWLFAILAAVLIALAVLGWRLGRRALAARAEAAAATQGPATEIAEEPADAARERAEIASDAGLSTRLPENSRELRRRYIEERFPEIANRTLVLEDASAVVKAARLYYEDGALARAVELLQFCIEDNPGEVRFWLALFEIFRVERLQGEFAELAGRFRQRYSRSELWTKVQYFGREIDPGNPLYKEEPLNTLETIGPAEARRMKARGAVDPIAENWLEAPMDFENEVLANELRRRLMTQAGISDKDLAPNPMPVLRNVEMFQVA